MKNIAIYYKGGSGGFFIYYYILASDSNIFSHNVHDSIKIGKSKKLLDTLFYAQFTYLKNLNNWKNNELWPNSKKLVDKNNRQLFLFVISSYKGCDEFPDFLDVKNTKIINPYIPDKKNWLRIQVEKRCYKFHKFPKSYSYKKFFNHYKKAYYDNISSKIDNVNYNFNFLKFIQDINERKKLCNFLNIKINNKMEEYLTHYLKCQQTLLTKLLK